jgi:hypothetical protein
MTALARGARLRRAIAIGAVLILVAGAAVAPWVLEDWFLYHPRRDLGAAPADYHLAHEDVWLDAAGARTHAWFLPGGGRATVVFFHGNGGTIADRLHVATAWIALGFDVLMAEYPGYGRSAGRPSEPSLRAAAQAAWSWVRTKRPAARVVAFGESLGGAVAIDLAARQALDAVVVQSTFTSIADMARVVFPWLFFDPPLRNRFDSLASIRRVRVPTLILHGDSDDFVPFSQGQRLFAAAAGPKRFVKLEGAHHNDTVAARAPEYFGAVDTFLREHGM